MKYLFQFTLCLFAAALAFLSVRSCGTEPGDEDMQQQEDFIKSQYAYAMRVQHQYGVPAYVSLSAAALLTNFGDERDLMDGNAMFLIESSKGHTGNADTSIVWMGNILRSYQSTDSAYVDFARTILPQAQQIGAFSFLERWWDVLGYNGYGGAKDVYDMSLLMQKLNHN